MAPDHGYVAAFGVIRAQDFRPSEVAAFLADEPGLCRVFDASLIPAKEDEPVGVFERNVAFRGSRPELQKLPSPARPSICKLFSCARQAVRMFHTRTQMPSALPRAHVESF